MLTLLGSLLGFGTSIIPAILKMFTDKADKAHELAVMDKQIEAQKVTGAQRLQEINVDADIRETEALQASMRPTGVKWADGLTASVRPVITYAFFGLFIFVEVSSYFLLIRAGVEPLQTGSIIWNEEIQALFAGIISFWFGHRSMHKAVGGR